MMKKPAVNKGQHTHGGYESPKKRIPIVGGENGTAPGSGRHLQNHSDGAHPKHSCDAGEYFTGTNEGMYG